MFDWKKKKVLVTGAGGFIGSHLTEKLVKLGAKVSAFVHYNSRNDRGLIELLPKEIQKNFEVFVGDLKDPEAVRNAVKPCEIIFHLGALISIPYSYINPLDFIQTNVVGTANILNACRDNGIDKIIHTSTSEVYGTARYTPMDENHPLQGQSPYSASKIGADKIAESYYLSFELPVVVLRPFNTYGPRQSVRAVIPTIIAQALVFEKIKLGSIFTTRDFTYISDTVDDFVKTAETSNTVGQVINLGSGVESSIEDIVKMIGSIIGKELEIEQDPERVRPKFSEVERLISDNAKAKKILNFNSRVSLEDGLTRTVDWFSNNMDKYKPEIYNF